MASGIAATAFGWRMLERFRAAKRTEVRTAHGPGRGPGAAAAAFSGPRPSLFRGHSWMRPSRDGARAVIAEYKRASPSKGDNQPGGWPRPTWPVMLRAANGGRLRSRS